MNRSALLGATIAFTVPLILAACGRPPQAAPGAILGYGTPGVSSYVPAVDADSLQALLDRCRQVPDIHRSPRPQTIEAACDQLQRTRRNQPGNTVAAAP